MLLYQTVMSIAYKYYLKAIIASALLIFVDAYSFNTNVNWPIGSAKYNIQTFLEMDRDYRNYSRIMLIYNFSDNAVFLQNEVKNKNKNLDWQIPSKQIGILLLKQESIKFSCLEQAEMGEQFMDCNELLEVGLLPDTLEIKSKKNWLGNFVSMSQISKAMQVFAVHLITSTDLG